MALVEERSGLGETRLGLRDAGAEPARLLDLGLRPAERFLRPAVALAAGDEDVAGQDGVLEDVGVGVPFHELSRGLDLGRRARDDHPVAGRALEGALGRFDRTFGNPSLEVGPFEFGLALGGQLDRVDGPALVERHPGLVEQILGDGRVPALVPEAAHGRAESGKGLGNVMVGCLEDLPLEGTSEFDGPGILPAGERMLHLLHGAARDTDVDA